MTNVIYDVEVLPNVFTFTGLSESSGKIYQFEISPRKNEYRKFITWINNLKLQPEPMMIGFNNIHYDYPIIHHLIKNIRNVDNAKHITNELYKKSQAIFNAKSPFEHTVWDNQHLIPQMDLFKIHHFDNKARSTSLKRLQFNMRLKSIQEFEVPFNERVRKSSVINHLLKYNDHDVVSTFEFKKVSQTHIDFRLDMSNKYEKSFNNYNDTKIGEELMTMLLIDEVGEDIIYTENELGKRVKRKTIRDVMPVKDLLFEYVKFKTPEFQKILDFMKELKVFVIDGKFKWNENDDFVSGSNKLKTLKKELTTAKKDLKKGLISDDELEELKQSVDYYSDKYADHDITCELNGFEFVFGKGGLHGSLNNTFVDSENNKIILDIDVTSYYPSIGIENNLYPEHLTESFCPVYAQQKERRMQFAKGTVENKGLKLLLNGAYGKTNSEFSVFYDPLYTVTTTINGQLMLCMLWEELLRVPNCKLIQANTDGITIQFDNIPESKKLVKQVCRKWEKLTKLNLEYAVYNRMWIRDGNNYIAEYKDGKLKSKGAYLYSSLYHGQDETDGVEWHKDHSMIIVKKAVEAELVYGIPAYKFIADHEDLYDFFLCTNVPRSSKLYIGDGIVDGRTVKSKKIPSKLSVLNDEIQRVTRYLITKSQDSLTKEMPPIKGSVNKRYSRINAGYNVTVCNDIVSEDINDYDINYQFYIDEAEKLLEPFNDYRNI